MRFLPLLSSLQDPDPWISFRDVELNWKGDLHPGWESAVRAGLGVHALHLRAQPWGEALVLEALGSLRPRLGADFLVIPAEAPSGRTEWAPGEQPVPGCREDQARFLGTLEALLEALQGRGVKIALRPARGAMPALVALLKELRCDAVGYCWDSGVGADLEALSDRLFCAVGDGDADFSGLRRLGYRWNLALPASDPDSTARTVARLQASHPMIYFPEVTP